MGGASSSQVSNRGRCCLVWCDRERQQTVGFQGSQIIFPVGWASLLGRRPYATPVVLSLSFPRPGEISSGWWRSRWISVAEWVRGLEARSPAGCLLSIDPRLRHQVRQHRLWRSRVGETVQFREKCGLMWGIWCGRSRLESAQTHPASQCHRQWLVQ